MPVCAYSSAGIFQTASLTTKSAKVLAALESWQTSRGGDFLLVTQNIDTLHEQAGSRRLIALHGFTQTHHHVHPVAFGLARRAGFGTVVVPDAPGHGLGGSAPAGIPWWALAMLALPTLGLSAGLLSGRVAHALVTVMPTAAQASARAITADEVAKEADFFSFGTNDLTQMTYAFSRDDVESKLLPAYQALGILPANPQHPQTRSNKS